MKAYGKPRKACANRKIKGTNIDCPCCTPRGSNSDEATKSYKAKERRLSCVNEHEIEQECDNCSFDHSMRIEKAWDIAENKCMNCPKMLVYISSGTRRSAIMSQEEFSLQYEGNWENTLTVPHE